MDVDFRKALVRVMLITSAVIVPLGLLLSWLIGKNSALAGAAVGFAIAAANSVAVTMFLTWALSMPTRMLPSLLMVSYIGRLIILAVVLWGLHYARALDMAALLACFLVLYLTHAAVEMLYAWKSFGFALKGGDREDG